MSSTNSLSDKQAAAWSPKLDCALLQRLRRFSICGDEGHIVRCERGRSRIGDTIAIDRDLTVSDSNLASKLVRVLTIKAAELRIRVS